MAKAIHENELRLIRAYDAPLELVWDVWTDPNHVKNWWGPRGFTLTTRTKDLRPGGQWIYTMHGPDGVDYPNITTYLEVDPQSRLVYDHGGTEDRPPLFRVTVTFKAMDGKTIMDMTMSFETPEVAKRTGEFIKQVRGDSTWDRLAEYLEEAQMKEDAFFIHQSFSAPRKTLFEMWTNPDHLAKWMGPKGSTMVLLKADVREGGSLHYGMNGMHGLVHYKVIQPDSLLVYSQSFCDQAGKIQKPPFSATWPNAMLTTVTFTEEGPHETRIALKWEIDGSATEAERKTFHEAKAGMTTGWAGSLDQLDEALRNA